MIFRTSCLAGYELESVRYLVLVSEERQVMPDDQYVGDIIYRYRTIAVNPPNPSTSARSQH
jgi:hypothetical protein